MPEQTEAKYDVIIIGAGGIGAQQELARPIADRLFFAGEATESDGHHATVHGAFSSGVRVAEEILKLRKD
jgi:monoamine oxidase